MKSKDYIKHLETSVNAMKQNNTREISIIGTTSYFESMVKTLKQDLERKEKLAKAIELLKDMFDINLWVDDMDCYIRVGKCDYLISWEQYGILSEVFGE